MDSPKRPRSIAGAIILILLGIVFLLSNFGILSWNTWDLIWRLWPIWLIAVGLELVLGRTVKWGSWLVVGLVVLIAGIAISFPVIGGWEMAEEPQQISQPLDGATKADVNIGVAVAQLRLGAANTESLLAEGYVGPVGQLQQNFDVAGNTAHYTLRNEKVSVPWWGRKHSGIWDLRLNPNVSMNLRITTGVGESELDLQEMNLTGLAIKTGVGETTITLPQSGSFGARIETGIGETTIIVPRGMAVRVQASAGIGEINMDGNFQRNGDRWISPGYDQAPNKVDMQVTGGIGEVTISER